MAYKRARFQGNPENPQEIVDWTLGEFEEVESGFFDLDLIRFVSTNVEPTKPRVGDIRLADGANWDPGLQEGVYAYYAAAWHKLVGGRELLSTDRTYYVRLDGDDDNTGLENTAGGAWRTLQYAWDTVSRKLDLGGHRVTIKLADGDYSGDGEFDPDASPFGGLVKIEGNTSDRSAVILQAVQATNISQACWMAWVTLKDFFYTNKPSCIWHCTDMRFTGTQAFQADVQSTINLYTPLTFAGSTFQYTHGLSNVLYCQNQGTIVDLFNTHALTDGINVGSATVEALTLGFIFSFSTYTGAGITGKRYSVSSNAVVQTFGAGANHFPGSIAGTTATGGVYL